MARARTRRGKRGSRAGRISFKVTPKIRKAIARAKTVVRKAVIVGDVENGKPKFSASQLKKVTGRMKKSRAMKKSLAAAPEIVFVALNAPFKTKALTGAA